jgi:DNA modification methylase
LGGATPLLMVADPPYGVSFDPAWFGKAGLAPKVSLGRVKADDRVDWREAYALVPGDVAYCWHADRHASATQASLEAAEFEIRSQVIWAKQHFAITRGHYHWQHEPCWYAVRKGKTAHWHGGRKQTTVWNVANRSAFGGEQDDASTHHSTQKPVEVMRRPIENHTLKGEAVYDPFLGSGTTMIAAEQTERVCLGIDIDPNYVDVAVRRWQDFAGAEATLEGDGRTFAEVAAERLEEAA